MKFNSIDEIRQHKFVGHFHSDEAAFKAIDNFAADEQNSLAHRAEALRIMGRDGMGLDPEQNLEHLSDEEVIVEFMVARENAEIDDILIAVNGLHEVKYESIAQHS